jgi:hypothetical protein
LAIAELAKLLGFDKADEEADKPDDLHLHKHLHVESPVDEIDAELEKIAQRRRATGKIDTLMLSP